MTNLIRGSEKATHTKKNLLKAVPFSKYHKPKTR